MVAVYDAKSREKAGGSDSAGRTIRVIVRGLLIPSFSNARAQRAGIDTEKFRRASNDTFAFGLIV